MFTIERLFTIWHLSPSRCSSDTCCDFPPLLAAFPAKPDLEDNEDSSDNDLDDNNNDGSESDNKLIELRRGCDDDSDEENLVVVVPVKGFQSKICTFSLRLVLRDPRRRSSEYEHLILV